MPDASRPVLLFVAVILPLSSSLSSFFPPPLPQKPLSFRLASKFTDSTVEEPSLFARMRSRRIFPRVSSFPRAIPDTNGPAYIYISRSMDHLLFSLHFSLPSFSLFEYGFLENTFSLGIFHVRQRLVGQLARFASPFANRVLSRISVGLLRRKNFSPSFSFFPFLPLRAF